MMTRRRLINKRKGQHVNTTSHAPSHSTKSSVNDNRQSSSQEDEDRESDDDQRETTTERSHQITSVTSQGVNLSSDLHQSSHSDDSEDDVEVDYDEEYEEEAHDDSHHQNTSSSSLRVSSPILEQELTKSSTSPHSKGGENHSTTITT